MNDLMKSVMKQLNVNVVHGGPYHPQSQGKTERNNRTIKSKLFKWMIENPGKPWPSQLLNIVMCFNRTPIRSLGDRSPYEVLRRRVPDDIFAHQEHMPAQHEDSVHNFELAGEVMEDIWTAVESKQEARALKIIQKTGECVTKFKPGNLVRVRTPPKFAKKTGEAVWHRKATIAEALQNFSYFLIWDEPGFDGEQEGERSKKPWPHRNLKPRIEPESWAVKTIIAVQHTELGRHYLVHWEGYPITECTLEMESNVLWSLLHCDTTKIRDSLMSRCWSRLI